MELIAKKRLFFRKWRTPGERFDAPNSAAKAFFQLRTAEPAPPLYVEPKPALKPPPKPRAFVPPSPAFASHQPPIVHDEPAADEDLEPMTETALRALTRARLIEIAGKRDVDVETDDNKAGLVAKILRGQYSRRDLRAEG